MNARVAVGLAAGSLALVLAAVGIASLVVRTADAPPTDVYRGSEPPGRIEMVDFALRDERGRLVGVRALAGKAVALTFLDTQCEETCPVVAGLVGAGVDRLPRALRSSVAAVAISTDPRGDTAVSRRAFLRRHGADGRLRYLSGPLATLQPIWKSFQILSSHESGDDEVHSAPVRIYDPDGIWVSTLHAGVDLTPANLAHDLRAALRREKEAT